MVFFFNIIHFLVTIVTTATIGLGISKVFVSDDNDTLANLTLRDLEISRSLFLNRMPWVQPFHFPSTIATPVWFHPACSFSTGRYFFSKISQSQPLSGTTVARCIADSIVNIKCRRPGTLSWFFLSCWKGWMQPTSVYHCGFGYQQKWTSTRTTLPPFREETRIFPPHWWEVSIAG